MKTKPLFAVAIAALALASCSDQDNLSVAPTSLDSDAISFRPAMGSRATETTNANITDIYVTSFINKTKPYFQNARFTKGADSFFTSTGDYVWLSPTDTLQFISISPAPEMFENTGGEFEFGNGTMALNNFAVPEEISEQFDFISANATGIKKANSKTGVELTFDHRLAQVEIRAKSASKTYNYEVTGARIGRVEYMGSYNFATNEWTLDDWHDTQIYDTSFTPFQLTDSAQSLMGDAGNAMLMPQQLTPWNPSGDPDNVARESYLSVQVKITRKDNGVQVYPFASSNFGPDTRTYAWASIPLGSKWEAGKKYIYTLDFSDGAGNVDPDDPNPGEPILGPIKFKVNVNNWVDSDNSIAVKADYSNTPGIK